MLVKYNFLILFFKNLGYTITPIVKEDIEELLDRCNKVKTLRQYIIDNLLPVDLNEAIMFEIWF